MKTLPQALIGPQAAILLLALALLYGQSLPAELLWLDLHYHQQLAAMLGPEAVSARVPSWYHSGNQLLWAIALAFVGLLLPRLRGGLASLCCLLVLLSLAALPLLANLKYHLWLPQGLLLQFLVISCPLIILWTSRRRRWQGLIAQRDDALQQLVDYKLQENQLDQALVLLQQCQPSLAVAEQGYRLAQQQEQRRAYDDALISYQWLASFAAKYKDVADRARGSSDTPIAADGDELSLTQTVAADFSSAKAKKSASRPKPVLGRYRIDRELGRGAMGIVYLGADPKIDRQVAIKTLSYKMFQASELPALKQRFFREAVAAGRLNHPNIVTVFDVGEERDLSFIAMDYVPGEPLSEHCKDDDLLAVDTVYRLIEQVAQALHYAHQNNIVHRDIKPGNLLYDRANNVIKVADFGIARITDNSQTRTGNVLGSPLYMSPEQLKGQKVEGSSDIYSLGATFYQLLTGQPPYNGNNIAELAYQVTNNKHPSVRKLRPALPASATRIVNKAMAKEPAKRFADAGEMAAALGKALQRDFS